MNKKFIYRNRLFIIAILILFVVENLLIVSTLNFSESLYQASMKINNLLFFFGFTVIIIILIILFHTPRFFKESLSSIFEIVSSLSTGNYKSSIDLDKYEKKVDNEVFVILEKINEMATSIRKFDSEKERKIIENKNRILSLMSLSNEGFIIVSVKGKVEYINDKLNSVFPKLKKNVNIIDSNFKPILNNTIKKCVEEVLEANTSIEEISYHFPKWKTHLRVKSSLVRVDGELKNIVVKVENLPEISDIKNDKKKEKTEDK